MSTLLINVPFSDRFVAKIEAGLASERPTADGIGHAYFSTDTEAYEIWDGSSWVSIAGAGGGTPTACCAMASRDTNFNVSASSSTPIEFDTEDIDTDGIWAIGNPSRFTIPAGKTGIWRLSFQYDATFSAQPDTSTITQIQWTKNGTTDIGSTTADLMDGYSEQRGVYGVAGNFTILASLTAGDYVEVEVYQSSTGETLGFEGHVMVEFVGALPA